MDPDCVAVFQGDACNTCGCPNAAIKQSALAQYQKDLAALQTHCGPRPKIACADCSPRLGLCLGGSCTSRPQ